LFLLYKERSRTKSSKGGGGTEKTRGRRTIKEAEGGGAKGT